MALVDIAQQAVSAFRGAASPSRPTQPTGPGTFVSYTRRGGRQQVLEENIDPNRDLVVMKPPKGSREAAVSAIDTMKAWGFQTRDRSMCSLAMQQSLRVAGVVGVKGGGAGNAKDLPESAQLKAAGYTIGDPSNIEPGDLIIYRDKGGGFGHVGIASSRGSIRNQRSFHNASVEREQRALRARETAPDPLGRFSAMIEETANILGNPLVNHVQDFSSTISELFHGPDASFESSFVTPMLLELTDGMPEIQQIILWAYGGGKTRDESI